MDKICMKRQILFSEEQQLHIQSNLNSSNTDGSFTMANSKSLVPTYNKYHYENMPIQIYWKLYHQKMKVFR